jgi:hypothetical protein
MIQKTEKLMTVAAGLCLMLTLFGRPVPPSTPSSVEVAKPNHAAGCDSPAQSALPNEAVAAQCG